MEVRKIGNWYHNEVFGNCLLAQVGGLQVTFICAANGNRVREPVEVATPSNISNEEWKKITKNIPEKYILIDAPSFESKKAKKIEEKEIGRKAKVHYQKSTDGLNKIVKLEGFLTAEEIIRINPEVKRLWGKQEHEMNLTSAKDTLWINKTRDVWEGCLLTDEEFKTVISEMKTCGKTLAKIIKDVGEAEKNPICTINI